MPEPVAPPPVPGLVPKAALVTARIAHKPAHLPEKATDSALMVGGATHHVVGNTNLAAKTAVEALQPRGPVKLVSKLFDRVDRSLASSAGKATTATEVFWKPLSIGAEQVGQAAVNPLAYVYAKRAGYPNPTDPKVLDELTHSKGWPVYTPPAEEPKAGGDGGNAQGTPTPDGQPTPQAGGDGGQSTPQAGGDGQPTPQAGGDGGGNPGIAPHTGNPGVTPDAASPGAAADTGNPGVAPDQPAAGSGAGPEGPPQTAAGDPAAGQPQAGAETPPGPDPAATPTPRPTG